MAKADPWLLADVGGTNTRLALADRDGPIAATHLPNASAPDFATLAGRWLAGRPVRRACVALAGPVEAGRRGRLTNRDWDFDAAALGRTLGAPVTLVNDLAALGHGLGALGAQAVEVLRGPAPDPARQCVVLGIGTGVNVCAVGGGRVWAAEYGHTSLPAPLGAAFPAAATVEDLFSGRGLAERLGAPAEVLLAPDRPEPAAALIPALATLVAEVAFAYWPEGGLVLNGSVARALLVGPRRDAFLAALPQGRAGVSLRDIPLALMADDAAALHGCRAILRAL